MVAYNRNQEVLINTINRVKRMDYEICKIKTKIPRNKDMALKYWTCLKRSLIITWHTFTLLERNNNHNKNALPPLQVYSTVTENININALGEITSHG